MRPGTPVSIRRPEQPPLRGILSELVGKRHALVWVPSLNRRVLESKAFIVKVPKRRD